MTQSIDQDSWVQFMLDAGIPYLDAVEYAVSFLENDIEREHLAKLNADFLKMLDVKKVGRL